HLTCRGHVDVGRCVEADHRNVEILARRYRSPGRSDQAFGIRTEILIEGIDSEDGGDGEHHEAAQREDDAQDCSHGIAPRGTDVCLWHRSGKYPVCRPMETTRTSADVRRPATQITLRAC